MPIMPPRRQRTEEEKARHNEREKERYQANRAKKKEARDPSQLKRKSSKDHMLLPTIAHIGRTANSNNNRSNQSPQPTAA